MVMDEREPILRGAKAPAHARSQSYDAEATLGGPAEGRASRDAAIEPVRNSSRRGFRVSVALLAVIGLVAGVASGVARSAASDASSVAPSASEASEGKGARVTATDTRFREVFSRSFAEASNEAFVETIAAASAAGRRDNSRSPSPELGQGPVHDLDTPCDGAVREPVGYGPNGVFTETMLGLVDYADAVYIICTSNCLMTIPEVLRGKALMVDGFRVDQCLGSGASTHWIGESDPRVCHRARATEPGEGGGNARGGFHLFTQPDAVEPAALRRAELVLGWGEEGRVATHPVGLPTSQP